MELPHLGKHCSKSDCKKLDFLSIKCDSCNNTFCGEHYSYLTHNCPNSYQKDNQVPVCPLCNTPVPVGKGQQPDFVVGAHIDNDCQADPAKSRRKVFTNRCSFKKCKNKEVIPVICSECKLNFCLKHRHTTDHFCEGRNAAVRNKWTNNIQQNNTMSEDEALARALALSMQDSRSVVVDKKRQEELDAALARQLQASEQNTTASSSSTRERCNVS